MLVVSLPAGALCDRISKSRVIVWTKGLEVVLMAAAVAVLAFAPGEPLPALVVLGAMGLQSGLFSPAKYGILPEVLPHERLSDGNGKLEMWSFLAIVLGTAAGGLLLDAVAPHTWIAGTALLVFALAGWGASFGVPRVPAAQPQGAAASALREGARALRADRALWLAVVGLALFWGVASLLGQVVLVYAKATLHLGDALAGLPLAAVGIGIGAGGVLAGRLSAGKVEMGLVPLGALGMAAFVPLLALLEPGFAGTIAIMAALGAASGVLLVPLNALLQWRAPPERRGSVIALANVLTGCGMLAGTFATGLFAKAGVGTSGILLVTSGVVLLGTLWALWLLPAAGLRLALVIATSTVYRLRVVGRGNVPARGGVLLTPNHVSFADGVFVIAALDRPVRFLIDDGYFRHPLLKPFLAAIGGIPVSASLGKDDIRRALASAGEALGRGEVVCIFPEGQITRTGGMQQFRRGLERIAAGRDCVIVPVHLDNVWGSVFSRADGRFLWKRPKRLPYPVTVAFGAPLPADTSANDVRRAVAELGADAWELRRELRTTLHRRAVRVARRRPFAFAMADAQVPRLSRIAVLAGAVALARALREELGDEERVGVLLPTSVGGALVNLALSLAGRTSVNLNYAAGPEAMAAAVRIAGVRHVITARAFCEKARTAPPEGTQAIHVDELRARIGGGARATAFLFAAFAPVRVLERACGMQRRRDLDAVATILFSSGSTSEPKGVPLSHFNIGANVEALAQVLRPESDDRLLAILPHFHAFGLLALWFALNRGVPIAFHPNPLDAGGVGTTAAQHRATLLLATPTFLALYTRAVKPTQFGALRLVIAGAEKLSDAVRQGFEDRFGVRPFEGYGATECAPAVAVGIPDYRAAGFFQPGTKRGTVGQPLPGVAVRIVDPLTFEPCAAGTPGLILVKGPNVMRGYLDRPDLSAAALRDGWYVTGDVGVLDDDGFLAITDRLARFAKIGGEMVPCTAIEEALHTAAESGGGVFAVAPVPDARRGERLAVVHTWDGDVAALLERVRAAGLPNLFVPRAEDFVRVDAIPLLGTGKVDLRAVKRLAEGVR